MLPNELTGDLIKRLNTIKGQIENIVKMLALFFGIGRGLPFLIVSLFAGSVSKFAQLTWLRKAIQLLSGLALLFVAYYYIKVFVNLQ